MSDDPTTTTPVDPVTLALAMRICVLADRQNDIGDEYASLRAEAMIRFAELPARGLPQVELTTPGGDKIGLISIERGAEVWTVDEDDLLLVAATNDSSDIEHVVSDRALRDPKVIDLIRTHLPDARYVTAQIKPSARKQYETEYKENGGLVADRNLREKVRVAVLERRPPTGKFTYRASPKSHTLIQEAIAAGVIDQDGNLLSPPVTDSQTVTDPHPEPPPDGDAEPGFGFGDPGDQLFFDDQGRFKTPELAAFHAMQVQGGFSTPARECRRMLQDAIRRNDAGYATMCTEWLSSRGLSPDGDDEPAPAPVNPLAAAQPVGPKISGDDIASRVARAKDRSRRAERPSASPVRGGLEPTEEQQKVIEAWAGSDANLTIRAAAGSGKTSTLVMLGDAARTDGTGGLYIAYNKAIATEAKRKFPSNVACSTAHSLAFQAVGRHYSHRLNGPRMRARDIALTLGINEPVKVEDGKILSPEQVGRLAMETVERFMRSADAEVGPVHVPCKPGLDSPGAMSVLRTVLTPLARKAWADLVLRDGKLRFSHDCYLKMWQLTSPVIGASFLLVDEAQDLDPVMRAVLLAQMGHSRIVTVGDANQQIYEWRGAINAMDAFDGTQLTLTKSFRFGTQIAAQANNWLTVLESDMRVVGNDRISSIVRTVQWPDAILCRTNSGALAQAMEAVDAGKATAIVGGGGEIRKLADAAAALKAGRPTSHPELFAFSSWAEVQDHVENDPSGSDLAVMVRLIDEHGPEGIIRIIDSLKDEKHAELVVSTAHKSKGLEWDSVRIGSDFRAPRRDPENPDQLPPVNPADGRLAYVAVTRAKLVLDRGPLAYVDDYLAEA